MSKWLIGLSVVLVGALWADRGGGYLALAVALGGVMISRCPTRDTP